MIVFLAFLAAVVAFGAIGLVGPSMNRESVRLRIAAAGGVLTALAFLGSFYL
jgi:hypothetical protein